MSASIQVSDLVTPQTSDQILQQWIDQLVLLGIPANQWRKGGVARTMLAVFAISLAVFTSFLADLVNGGFLPTATGAALTLLARYVYGVERVQATFASGFYTLTNTGGGLYEHAAGEVTVKDSASGQTYTLGAFVLNPGATVTGIPVTAQVIGSGANAAPGAIDTLVTQLTGVTGTNPSAVVGIDEQTDPDLRAECTASLGALSPNGPQGAYDYAIRNAKRADGSPVNINRWDISPFSSTGQVLIALASPAGVPLPDDVTAVQTAIEAGNEKDVATVTASAATTTALASTVTVWADAELVGGLGVTDLQTLVATALAAYVGSYAIGGKTKPPSTQGYLFASALDGVAKGAHPSIYAVDGFAADIPLAFGQVATMAANVVARIA